LLREVVHLPTVKADQLGDRAVMDKWCTALAEVTVELEARDPQHRYDVRVVEDNELNIFVPEVEITSHGVSTHYRFGRDFFKSSDYQSIAELGESLQGLLEDGAYIKRGERTQEVESFDEVMNWLMAQAERGINVQRYKGLGEMNPDQLWETTMDPDARRMLRVTIEDAIAADQIFTCLMGDQVEPRRDFIESNALKVANLDV